MKKIFSLLALTTLLLWGAQVKALVTLANTDLSDMTTTQGGSTPVPVHTNVPFYVTGAELGGASARYNDTSSYPANIDGVATTKEAIKNRTVNFIRLGSNSDALISNLPKVPTTNFLKITPSANYVNGGQLTLTVCGTSNNSAALVINMATGALIDSIFCPTKEVKRTKAITLPNTFTAREAVGIVRVTSAIVLGVKIETNSASPTITATPTALTLSTPANASVDAGDRTVKVSGAALTGNLSLSIQAGGSDIFSVPAGSQTITASGTLAATDVVLTLGDYSAMSGVKRDTLVISGGGATTVKVPLELTVTAKDQSKPRASVFFPAHNVTDIATATKIYAVFDKEVTVNDAAKITINSAAVTSAVASNDTLYITASLAKNTAYTVALMADAVKDAANNLSADTSWTFTTDGTAPTVVSKEPEGASGAPIKPIKIVFSEDIVKVAGPSIKVNGGSVGVTVSGNTLTLKDTTIRPLTTYSVEIPKEAIADLSGNELADTIRWTFKTLNDAIVFPYIPTLDENYVAPSWMSGKAYSPTQAVRGCASYKSTTGVFNTSTLNDGNKASGACYVIMDLPSCGIIKFRSSYTSARVSTIVKVVDGVETQLLSRTWTAANTCNYDSINVNEFGPVTVKISASNASGGGDIYALEIYEPVAAAPVLLSSAPAHNATQVPTTTSAITLTYNQDVQVASAANIKINSVAVASAVASGAVVTLTPAAALQGGTLYTVTATAGAIKSLAAAGALNAPAVNISFTTAAAGLVELPIIVENFQDWNNTSANCDTTVLVDLKLTSGATVNASLANCQVVNNGTSKSSPQTDNVSNGYVILGKEVTDAVAPAVNYPVGTLALPTIPNNIFVTKVWFTASATGITDTRGILLYKKGASDADWVQVGGDHATSQNGTVFSENINEANVQLKLTSHNRQTNPQLIHLHDLKVYGLIDPSTSTIPADPTGVSISAPSDTIFIGSSLQLTAVVTPSNAAQDVIWSTTSSRIEISTSGLVTTKASASAGDATVTVKVKANETISTTKTLKVVVSPNTAAGKNASQAKAGVHPNPVNGTLYVTSSEEIVKVNIISTTGVLLRTTTYSEVDVQGLASGSYFAMVYTKGKKLPAVISIVKE